MEKGTTIKALILSGFFALLGTIVGGLVQGYWNVKLAEQKYQSDLVLKALESSSPEERLQTLKMLVHTNLIKESGIRDSVSSYIIQKQKDPNSIPQVKSASQTLDAPIINNARVYLLAGDKAKTVNFADISLQLTSAGFKVMGAKTIIDKGRADNTEVRYFYPEDQQQAQKIAEFMRFRYNDNPAEKDKSFVAKAYTDSKVKSGYIEIWLGR
ncbi:MAG TPA: hypothetical protein VJ844_11935 [Mucilaginibacter sp.]|nr:hypothetical protein [Mucilaginibacter sp.]